MFYVLGFLLIAFCKHVNEPFAMLMVGRISDGFAIGLVSTREVEREAHLDPDPDTDTDLDTDTDTDTGSLTFVLMATVSMVALKPPRSRVVPSWLRAMV